MRNQLRSKSLHWLREKVREDFSAEKKAGITEWVKTI
jgi:hypothetical protein